MEIKNISLQTTKHWRSIVWIYFVQLLFGLVVAAFAYQHIKEGIGDSLELDRLAQGFDRAVFSDMINGFPQMINLFLNRFGIFIPIFLFVSIFLHAGLLGNIKRGEFTILDFIKSAQKYSIRFAGIAIVTMLKISIILALIWKPFTTWTGDPLQTFHSDKAFILTTLALVVFSSLLLTVVWLWSVLTRYQIIEGQTFVRSMKSAWRQLRSSFVKYFSIGILVILLHVLITYLYTLVVDDWGAAIWFYVLGLIFIQQLFSLARIWLRVFSYALLNGG